VRPVSQKLYELLGQPFVVDYRAGANGIIGSDLVAKSAPDGYTLLVISSSFTINASTYAKLPFDPLRDFAAVSSLATSDIIFVVNPDRARPQRQGVRGAGEIASRQAQLRVVRQRRIAAPGRGAPQAHVRIDMVHVPYKGASLALTDVVGGHVDSMFISAPGAIGQIRADKVRVLAVASARRARALPDTPTFAEAGLPEVQVDTRTDPRARRNAGCDHRAAAGGDRHGTGIAGRARALHRAEPRSGAERRPGIRRVFARRCAALAQGGHRGQAAAPVANRTRTAYLDACYCARRAEW
jgi:hypothetical protein